MARNVRKTNKSFLTLQSFLLTMLIAYSVEHMNTAQCLEFSEDEIKAIIEEDEHKGIYRLENKNEIKRFDSVDYEELKIFCHHGKLIEINSRHMIFKGVIIAPIISISTKFMDFRTIPILGGFLECY